MSGIDNRILIVIGVIAGIVLIISLVGFFKDKKKESFKYDHEPMNPMTISHVKEAEQDYEMPIDTNDVSKQHFTPTSQIVGTPASYNSADLMPKVTADSSHPNIMMQSNDSTFVDNTSCGSLFISSAGTSKKNAPRDIRGDVPITIDTKCITWGLSPLEPFPRYCNIC